MAEGSTYRLFIAAPCPEPWRAWIRQAQDSLEHALPDYFRWTHPSSWHITVLFLGAQPEQRVSAIADVLRSAAQRTGASTLVPRGLGTPGPKQRPRLVWLACNDGGALGQARDLICQDLDSLEIDPLPFRPHITLGRARRPSSVPFTQALNSAPKPDQLSPAHVDELILYRSHLEPGGPRYEALTRVHVQTRGN